MQTGSNSNVSQQVTSGGSDIRCESFSMAPELRLENNLGVFVLLFLEVRVALGRILEVQAVADEEGRIELPFQNHLQQLRRVFLYMRLAALDGESLFHERANRKLVGNAAVDTRD